MRIFIDIGHPAHVHYFRFLIKELELKDHNLLISARDKEVVHVLLKSYKIDFYNRGTGSNNLLGKFIYLVKTNFLLLLKSLKFKPDLFLSFASPYAAQVSFFLRKPHISLTDTENARLGILSFAPFSKHILTPFSFEKDFGVKHIRFNSFMELAYLHKNLFTPSKTLIERYNIKVPFIFLRFVSWNANHDINQSGLSASEKIQLVNFLEKSHQVLISSEGPLPKELEKYEAKVPPEEIHSLLFYSSLYIGEGATMASESAMLGTPSIYVNTLNAGTIKDQVKAKLVFHYTDFSEIINKTKEILSDQKSNELFKKRKDEFLNSKINLTSFLIWFIENYPKSVSIMQETPEFQYKFL